MSFFPFLSFFQLCFHFMKGDQNILPNKRRKVKTEHVANFYNKIDISDKKIHLRKLCKDDKINIQHDLKRSVFVKKKKKLK